MPYVIEIKASARKAFLSLPLAIRQRIGEAIDSLADKPRPHGAIKMFGGHNRYRVRVGDYRIIYEIHDEQFVILILRVAHRREAYRHES
ncbi:MAG: type II toxin-antitoxin system RelE/ParE family toxin [Candidatus Sumerlaeota bacterium]|nr:type II toxin-antitoxin system RelE/ParE family toxin [Candidatus Sumerlaeota bacterium]